ncbi:MAG: AtpZ/AtpI family protein [Proteobacteria bacterium]|nr:AtpZ/AtpI family protein [Pseudomonadota bacterium]
MSDDPHVHGDRGDRPPDAAQISARLRHLGERLDRLRSRAAAESRSDATRSSNSTALARGLRLSTELVAGVLVGAAIGWLIDRSLGITPWGMIVFLMLGFAAGVLNVIRSAGVAPESGEKRGD